MHERLEEKLSRIAGRVKIDTGESAWTAKAIPDILLLVLANDWIVLGGDVLNLEQHHTYDNWYFEPSPCCSLEVNARQSVERCLQYITNYIEKNGEDYLFVLTISDTFVGGKGRT